MIPFAEFLRLAYGRDLDPYPWQIRLAERCAHGEPPPAIAMPTGAGKTVTVDALIWALAVQAERPAVERTVGVRIVWAIDRRILVDEVHEHAENLARLLEGALADEGDPLHEMARRLARLSRDRPLVATRWRGGLEGRPERCGPLQPQIITSTVAQIGSRLLFRGYGVGRRSLAIEAGLAACDTTICLDEAHLAEPFLETIEAIRGHRAAVEREFALPSLRAIALTATPPREQEGVMVPEEDDRAALGVRLTGEKLARLSEPETGAGEAGQVKLLAKSTADYVREGHPTVACVVNTVRRARAVFDALGKELGEEAEMALLIGPQRSADRELMLERHRATLFEGRPGDKPLVCVATQTFEVGLDADVTALVSESASATALVQRLGRLNRRGGNAGRATIVRDKESWLYGEDERAAWEWLSGLVDPDGMIDVSVDALARSEPPRPTGARYAAKLECEIVELLAQTAPRPGSWAEPDLDPYLRGPHAKQAVEVSICWRCDLRPDQVGERWDEYRSTLLKLAPPQRQELLTLSMTAARGLLAARYYPQAGSLAHAARAALSEADSQEAMLDAPVPDPRQDETVVPFVVIRRGKVRRGVLHRPEDLPVDSADEEETRPIWPTDLRPGDVIVLPTSAGGVDEHGLVPLQPRDESAIDVAADRRSAGRPAPVRLTPEALAEDERGYLPKGRWRRIEEACANAERDLTKMRGGAARQKRVGDLIRSLRAPGLLDAHPGLGLLDTDVAETGRAVMLRSASCTDAEGMPEIDERDYETEEDGTESAAGEDRAGAATRDGDGARPDEERGEARPQPRRVWVLVPVEHAEREVERVDRYTIDEDGPPTIEDHALAVAGELGACADLLQLAPRLSATLELAARAHDHGKADPRTQAFYRRGVYTFAPTPIAKSEFGTHDPRTEKIARRLAGLPEHDRHEMRSVAILEDALASGATATDGLDPDLALHLDGVHHGHARPIPEVPLGGRPPRPFSIDAAGIAGSALGGSGDGWAEGAWLERFWRVLERYGAWGTAYLEALLVLSDRVVSSRGE